MDFKKFRDSLAAYARSSNMSGKNTEWIYLERYRLSSSDPMQWFMLSGKGDSITSTTKIRYKLYADTAYDLLTKKSWAIMTTGADAKEAFQAHIIGAENKLNTIRNKVKPESKPKKASMKSAKGVQAGTLSFEELMKQKSVMVSVIGQVVLFSRSGPDTWYFQEIFIGPNPRDRMGKTTDKGMYNTYIRFRKQEARQLFGNDAEKEFLKIHQGINRATTKTYEGSRRLVYGKPRVATTPKGIRSLKTEAVSKHTEAGNNRKSVRKTTKKPTARKTIKGQGGYTLIEKKRRGYCVPETKQTYWKRL